jgi:hypothetical protein
MATDLPYERRFLPFSVPFGLEPNRSEVQVADGALHIRFDWGFRAEILLTSAHMMDCWQSQRSSLTPTALTVRTGCLLAHQALT